MGLIEKQMECAKAVGDLLTWAFSNGHTVTLGEGYRTEEQHQWNLANGRSKAKRSKHQDRLAIDLNLFVNGEYQQGVDAYQPLGEYWTSIGGTWGGSWKDFPDPYHFEW
jgi:hypothetical protein